MTITSKDIKLFKAQDNTDNDSGGGSRTSNEVVDGQVNNLFPDISRIDTVSGDVALREVFPTVYTDNTDVYYGAHTMLRDVPKDPRVSALIFAAGSSSERRIDAQDSIESYVVASYESDFYLYGSHIAGTKACTFLQRTELQLPQVGEVYLLRDGSIEQYIRIIDMEYQDIKLFFNGAEYTRRRIIATIDQALQYAFTGSSFSPNGRNDNSTITFDTAVADAAKYYSTKTLEEQALIGAQTIKVDSIYEQLVPATKKQTPIINAEPLNVGVTLVAGGSDKMEASWQMTTSPVDYYCGVPVMPRTWSTAIGEYDDGKGVIYDRNANEVGTINYETGLTNIDFNANGNATVSFIPAITINDYVQFTGDTLITQGNQGLVFVENITPIPSVSNFFIDYRSNGKWYRLNANSDGTIGNDPSIGAGQINDNGDGTATINITLGSLPDIDSSIIYSWGSSAKFTNRVAEVNNLPKPMLVTDLGHQNINVDGMTFTITGGLANTATTVSADGSFYHPSGYLSGYVDGIEGKIYYEKITEYSTPSTNQSFTANFTKTTVGDNVAYVIANSDDNPAIVISDNLSVDGKLTLAIDSGAVENTFSTVVRFSNGRTNMHTIIKWNADEGRLVDYGSTSIAATDIAFDAVGGTLVLSYPTYGMKKLDPTAKYLSGDPVYNVVNEYPDLAESTANNATVNMNYRVAAPNFVDTIEVTGFFNEMTKAHFQGVGGIVGEVSFLSDTTDTPNYNETLTYYSENGVVYRDIDESTGIGIQAGTIDYTTGELVFDYYYQSYFSYDDNWFETFKVFNWFTDDIGVAETTINAVAFKTSATKLSPSSFQMRYKLAGSETVNSATSDQNGVVIGAGLKNSRVDSVTGMASIETSSSSLQVDSIFYDAIGETSLPLDPELLGLNPVRLPADGRVPVFEAGRHIIIFNEVETPVSPIAGQIVNLARDSQSYIEVIDVNGKRLDRDQYVADRTTGSVTFANPLQLIDKYGVPLSAPYRVVDRIEDMMLCSTVQINGLIELSSALSHDFPAENTKVASSLVWGDVGARVYNLFSQEYWDSGNPEWADELIGDPTTAQYDEINYPLEIDNKDSTTGRWVVIFRSSTLVDLVEEKRGFILQGVDITTTDIAPINPATNEPYFTMVKEGFGGGWVTNNCIRFNTDSGEMNMWIIRTVAAGALSEVEDSMQLEVRGDAN